MRRRGHRAPAAHRSRAGAGRRGRGGPVRRRPVGGTPDRRRPSGPPPGSRRNRPFDPPAAGGQPPRLRQRRPAAGSLLRDVTARGGGRFRPGEPGRDAERRGAAFLERDRLLLRPRGRRGGRCGLPRRPRRGCRAVLRRSRRLPHRDVQRRLHGVSGGVRRRRARLDRRHGGRRILVVRRLPLRFAFRGLRPPSPRHEGRDDRVRRLDAAARPQGGRRPPRGRGGRPPLGRTRRLRTRPRPNPRTPSTWTSKRPAPRPASAATAAAAAAAPSNSGS